MQGQSAPDTTQGTPLIQTLHQSVWGPEKHSLECSPLHFPRSPLPFAPHTTENFCLPSLTEGWLPSSPKYSVRSKPVESR